MIMWACVGCSGWLWWWGSNRGSGRVVGMLVVGVVDGDEIEWLGRW